MMIIEESAKNVMKALLQRTFSENVVECLTCIRRCKIREGASGYCGTRINRNGSLYTMIFGIVSSIAVTPIEKKPMFHFYPGSLWLSVGSFGCNFRCPGCQNWDISHFSFKKSDSGSFISPEELVKIAEKQKCIGISWTYNEPILSIEYIIDCAKICKKKGILTNLVTNGSFTEDAFAKLLPFLDSCRVDLKGFHRETYIKIAHLEDFENILNSIKKLKECSCALELITNVIPGFNDNEKEIEDASVWILNNLGENTPWHFTRFFPHRFLSHLYPTPIRTLEKFRNIAMGKGLKYVYLGNVPGHPAENTYCPNCKALLIERYNIQILRINLKKAKCPTCGYPIHGVFEN